MSREGSAAPSPESGPVGALCLEFHPLRNRSANNAAICARARADRVGQRRLAGWVITITHAEREPVQQLVQIASAAMARQNGRSTPALVTGFSYGDAMDNSRGGGRPAVLVAGTRSAIGASATSRPSGPAPERPSATAGITVRPPCPRA